MVDFPLRINRKSPTQQSQQSSVDNHSLWWKRLYIHFRWELGQGHDAFSWLPSDTPVPRKICSIFFFNIASWKKIWNIPHFDDFPIQISLASGEFPSKFEDTGGWMSSVQNPSIIPWNIGWFIGIPLLDYYNPEYIKGSIIPQLIINQPS